MDGDLHKIIVTPLDGHPTSDSEQITADCGHEAWIAATGRAVVANPFLKTTTVCMRCVTPEDMKNLVGSHGGLRAVPGTREALNRELGVAETDQMWARFNIKEGLGDE